MAFVYNQARLDELGVPVPTTWAEFKTAAQAVRTADPTTYLATFNTTEFGFFAGMAQQAGAKWWSVDGDKWTVGIDDEASQEVADYWQDLIDNDLIKVEDLLTPQWNQEVNAGQVLSWPSALWAPGVIYGVAESMAGQWAMAPLPQWTPGDSAGRLPGRLGRRRDHVVEAPEGGRRVRRLDQLQRRGRRHPARRPASTRPRPWARPRPRRPTPPLLMPQQTDFWKLASTIAGDTIPNISWGPNVNVAQSRSRTRWPRPCRTGRRCATPSTATQKVVVDDMKTTGFDVSE